MLDRSAQPNLFATRPGVASADAQTMISREAGASSSSREGLQPGLDLGQGAVARVCSDHRLLACGRRGVLRLRYLPASGLVLLVVAHQAGCSGSGGTAARVGRGLVIASRAPAASVARHVVQGYAPLPAWVAPVRLLLRRRPSHTGAARGWRSTRRRAAPPHLPKESSSSSSGAMAGTSSQVTYTPPATALVASAAEVLPAGPSAPAAVAGAAGSSSSLTGSSSVPRSRGAVGEFGFER
jgi:hypothetical protein